jgi:hypothetical protein
MEGIRQDIESQYSNLKSADSPLVNTTGKAVQQRSSNCSPSSCRVNRYQDNRNIQIGNCEYRLEDLSLLPIQRSYYLFIYSISFNVIQPMWLCRQIQTHTKLHNAPISNFTGAQQHSTDHITKYDRQKRCKILCRFSSRSRIRDLTKTH